MKSVANVLRNLLPGSKSLQTSNPLKKHRGRQLLFEPLEDRQMLSVVPAEVWAAVIKEYDDLGFKDKVIGDYNYIEVGVANPDNASSFEFSEDGLKAAITRAGQTTEHDLIVVHTTADQNKITLSGSELAININASNRGSITIVSLAQGDEKLTISASDETGKNSRVFNFGEDSTVALGGLTITNGRVNNEGGGIHASGILSITDCTISGNMAHAIGGGIHNNGTLAITNSTISDNTLSYAFGSGGGIYNNGTLMITNNSMVSGNSASQGAGINNSPTGTLTVENSTIGTLTETIAGNWTFGGGSGGGIYNSGTLTVKSNSTISGNSATNGGGGIDNSGTLTVTNSTISSNSANWGGGIFNSSNGTLTVENSIIGTLTETIAGNSVRGNGTGGGIDNDGILIVKNSTISGNSATNMGGGIENSGQLTVMDSTISNNSATNGGGGVYSYTNTSTVLITNSTISNNLAAYAGGIGNSGNYSTMTVTNCMISGNIVTAVGGGIHNNNGTMSVTNCTISGNTATSSGGGIYNGNATLTLYNTIIAENFTTDISQSGGTVQGCNNLTSFANWDNGSDLVGGNLVYNPNLPLFFNAVDGDYRLAPNSQAIDNGDDQWAIKADLNEDSLDMAGNLRFVGVSIDIGAYEFSDESILNAYPLTFGKTEIGKLLADNKFRDYWYFVIDEGTTLSFDLLQGSGLTIKLIGPNSFSRVLTEDSEEFTLIDSGKYYLNISSDKETSYAFRMELCSAEEIGLNSDFIGSFSGKITDSGYAKIFEVTTEWHGSLQFILNDLSGVNRNELYVRYGEAPTRTQYDWRTTTTGSSQILTTDFAPAGTYYVLVYSDYAPAPTDYTLTVNQSWFRLVDVMQNTLLEASTPANDLVLTLDGIWFEEITKVTLIDSQGREYDTQDMELLSYQKLHATFNKSNIPAGTYTVRITGASGATVQKENAFTKYAVEQAVWDATIKAPSALNSTLITTVLVEYTNAGNVPLVAPIVIVSAAQNDPDTKTSTHGAFLTTSVDAVNAFFKDRSRSYDKLPEGFGHEIVFLANGSVPGMIMPGETIRTTIYYAGWLAGSWDDFSSTTFTISSYQPTQTATIDWAAELFDLPAANVRENNAGLLDMVDKTLGRTWGEYVVNLNSVSLLLYENYGARITDIPMLQGILLDTAYDKWQDSLLPQPQPAPLPTGNAGIQPAAATQAASDIPAGTVYVYQGESGWVPATADKLIPGAENFVLIHGMNDSLNDVDDKTDKAKWLLMARALKQENPNANILGVDWSKWGKRTNFIIWDIDAVTPAYAIPSVAERVAYQLFGQEGSKWIPGLPPFAVTPIGIISDIIDVFREGADFTSLNLSPALTTVIGHSHGAHVAGLVSEYAKKYSTQDIQRLTVLDASEHKAHFSSNLWNFWGWDKNSATFVDYYKTSWLGTSNAMGQDNFVVLEKGEKWSEGIVGFIGGREDHSFVAYWYISTIKAKKPDERDAPGYGWTKNSWEEQYAKDIQANSGEWKGWIVANPSTGDWRFEALTVGLSPSTFGVTETYDLAYWDYPGAWSSGWLVASIFGSSNNPINKIQNALRKSYELTFKFTDKNIVVTPGKTYTFEIDVTDNSQIDSVSGRDGKTFSGVAAFSFPGGNTKLTKVGTEASLNVTVTPLDHTNAENYYNYYAVSSYSSRIKQRFTIPSFKELEAAFGKPETNDNGNYWYDLKLETTPVNYNIHELYKENDKTFTTIRIDIPGVWADAGNDETITIEPDEENPDKTTASVTLIGRGGVNTVVDNSSEGVDVDETSIYGYLWEKDGEFLREVIGTAPISDIDPLTVDDLSEGTYVFTLTVYGDTGKTIKASDTKTVVVTVKTPPQEDDKDNSPQVRSRDPNEIVGPNGYGEKGYITGTETLPYHIHFENDKDATAPAQRVDIEMVLHENLDWSTFEFSGFHFAGISVPLANGTYAFNEVVAMNIVPMNATEEVAILVDVSGGIDLAAGRVYVTFQTIDPDSEWGLPPFDIDTGFLLPEDGSGCGMGFVSYTIKPRSNLQTEDRINAVAKIQFDFGEIIYTNQIDPHDPSQGTDPANECWLTIDVTPPVSSVTPFTSQQVGTTFTVSWSGSDDGSGIACYDVYVSDNGGKFEIWHTQISATSAEYTGVDGHTYSFYSVAYDNVGHEETGTKSAEATVTVVDTVVNPPAAPTGLATSNPTTNSIALTWNASTGATGYDIQYRVSGTTDWGNANIVITGTTAVVSELDSGTSYEFQARAKNATTVSDWSLPTATGLTIPATPENLRSTAKSTNSVTLAWNITTGATGYDIQYRVSGTTDWGNANIVITGTTAVVSELDSGTSYEFQARAKNNSGESSTWSDSIFVETPPPIVTSLIALAADAGPLSQPIVQVYNAVTEELLFEITAAMTYGEGYTGGVRVATGDLNGDGVPDIVVVPGRNMAPNVLVFSGIDGTLLEDYCIPASATYGNSFKDGLNVAIGDVTGTETNDIILVPSGGQAVVKVFENLGDGLSNSAVRQFNAFEDYKHFIGGASLTVGVTETAVADADHSQIVIGTGAGIAPIVRVFDVVTNQSAYKAVREVKSVRPDEVGGVNVAVGDINGDGFNELILASKNGGRSWIDIYEMLPAQVSRHVSEFQAFSPAEANIVAVNLVVRDTDGDGFAEIIVTQGAKGRAGFVARKFQVKSLEAKLVDEIFAEWSNPLATGLFIG